MILKNFLGYEAVKTEIYLSFRAKTIEIFYFSFNAFEKYEITFYNQGSV